MKTFLRKWLGISSLACEVEGLLPLLLKKEPVCNFSEQERKYLLWCVQILDSMLDEMGYETKRTLVRDYSRMPKEEPVVEIFAVSKKKKKPTPQRDI